MTTLTEVELGPRVLLAEGGMAKVYRLSQFSLPENPQGQWVYKRFKRQFRPIPLASVSSLVSHRERLPPGQRAAVDGVAIWPTRAVTDDGAGAAGVVLPLISDDYFVTLRLGSGPKRKPAEGQFLFMDRSYCMGVGIPFLEEDARRQIVFKLCRAFALLHRAGVVYGDFSSRNFIYRAAPKPAVLLVDCDAVRIIGGASGFGGQPHSPDWEPPEALLAQKRRDSVGFTIQNEDTDRYKLGLAILRVLTPGPGCSTNRDPRMAVGALPAPLYALLTRSLSDDPRARPSAKEWHEEMSR